MIVDSLTEVCAVVHEDSQRIQVVKEIVIGINPSEYILHEFQLQSIVGFGEAYGIADVDEIIEFILFEPHIEEANPHILGQERARDLMRQRISDFKQEKVPTVPNSRERKDRFADHQLRMSLANISQEYIDAVEFEPRTVIREFYQTRQPNSMRFMEHTKNIKRDEPTRNSIASRGRK